MKHNISLKKEAVKLRKAGKTYNEILQKVPVAKSTLSLWLRDIGLAKIQQQRITQKRINAQKKGAMVRKERRINTEKEIFLVSKMDIGTVSKRELLLIGTALYWSEGSKASKK